MNMWDKESHPNYNKLNIWNSNLLQGYVHKYSPVILVDLKYKSLTYFRTNNYSHE